MWRSSATPRRLAGSETLYESASLLRECAPDLARTMAGELELSSSYIPSLHKPSSLLPIARHRDKLLYLIETYPVTIVIGQTGSGKTTQIPQFLEQSGWSSDGKIVAVTQVCKSYHLGQATLVLCPKF